MFADFGSDPGITFELNPAVRHPTGQCIEESNCDYEKVTLCAFSKQDIAGKVAFLQCMDETKVTDDAVKAAQACYKGTFSDVQTCYSGSQGQDLLNQASTVWNKAFPSRATVPHIFVNDKDTQPSYDTIKKALCAAGSPSSACK